MISPRKIAICGRWSRTEPVSTADACIGADIILDKWLKDMNCKYKLLSNERFCQVLHGECQFLKCGYGSDCPVYNAYPDWDGYVLSAQAKRDGTAQTEE